MKLELSTDHLPPIEIDPYESVTVWLPDGREVTVGADRISVRSKEDRARGRDGRDIWRAMSSRSRQWPYGKVRQPAGGEDAGGDTTGDQKT